MDRRAFTLRCVMRATHAAGTASLASCAKREFAPGRYARSRRRRTRSIAIRSQRICSRLDFTAARSNQRWVADITYIPTAQGWLYLAVVLDLYSRAIVGWAMDQRMTAQLVRDALTMALWRRGAVSGLLLHSDRGCQYACGDYQRLLRDHGIVCSMSRKGNCYDNAAMESFFGTLKQELVHHERYATPGSQGLDLRIHRSLLQPAA